MLFGPPPECPETEPEYCLIRRDVYHRLLRVQQRLPQGYRLRLYEGLRSLAMQALLFEQEKQRVRARHPALDDEQVHRQATVIVSPTVHLDGSPNIPPHSTGGAIDMEIVDAAGEVIDFGMEVRDWVRVPPEFCAPVHASLTEVAAQNRRLLARVMGLEGFVNYHNEWWHFSYGDRYWAAQTGNTHAIYGTCPFEMIAAVGK